MTNRIDLTAEPGKGRVLAAWIGGWAAYMAIDSLIVSTQSRVPLDRAVTYALADHLPLALASIALWYLCARRDRMSRSAFIAAHIALAFVAIAVAKAGYAL
jgi:hypothetical protein